MEEKTLRIILAKKNEIWSKLNVDIDPFVVILDTDGKILVAEKGNNLAEWRDGSIKKSYNLAKAALSGKRPRGGSKIYWKSGEYPKYKRVFFGAIGISGLGKDREHVFVRKFAGFRSNFHYREPLLYKGNLNKLVQVDTSKFD